jgi:hypothetical protein
MSAFFLILFVTLFRVIPHPANFAPMGAAAIVAGRAFPMRIGLPITFAAMVVSDAALSAIHGFPLFSFVSLFVYASFGVQTLLGRSLRTTKGGSFLAALSGALVFFALSNFGVWLQGVLYPRTAAGFLECYAMALPFFQMTLLGNLIWTPVLSLLFRPVSVNEREVPVTR